MTRRAVILPLCTLAAAVMIAAATGVTAVRSPSAPAGDEAFASVGTAELSGIYYPITKSFCGIVNRDLPTYRVRCSPETTPGSAYNIDALQSGDLDFAIVQSDIQFDAYKDEGRWLGQPFRGLRSVASLYPELVTVMARANSPIRDLSDLRGRRVSVGSEGSGTRATWEAIEAALGWHDRERVRPAEIGGAAASSALCSGAIDANMMIIGHPSPVVTAQKAACPIHFVAIAGPAIDKLLREDPYYQRGTIGGAAYGSTEQVPTFGVRATLVTSAAEDSRVVGVIAQELLTHLAELRALNPALAGLTAGEMVKEGLTAPLHPAAAQAYRELELRE